MVENAKCYDNHDNIFPKALGTGRQEGGFSESLCKQGLWEVSAFITREAVSETRGGSKHSCLGGGPRQAPAPAHSPARFQSRGRCRRAAVHIAPLPRAQLLLAPFFLLDSGKAGRLLHRAPCCSAPATEPLLVNQAKCKWLCIFFIYQGLGFAVEVLAPISRGHPLFSGRFKVTAEQWLPDLQLCLSFPQSCLHLGRNEPVAGLLSVT